MITAQTTLLSNQRIAASIRMGQMTASVSLIRALGGGWDASRLWSQTEPQRVRESADMDALGGNAQGAGASE